MGYNHLANAIKRHATSLDGRTAQTRAGNVTSVSPDGTAVKVTILPDGMTTGWVPVSHIGVGANTIIAPPNVGDFVAVQPHEGDAENWIMTGRLFNTQQPPPNSPITNAPTKPGEVAIINASGSTLHMTLDGAVSITAQNINFTAVNTLTITAPNVNVKSANFTSEA